MNEAFIWLSGHRIIDREIFNGYKFFRIFTENNLVMWDSKTFCIPEAKGLISKCFLQREAFRVLQVPSVRTKTKFNRFKHLLHSVEFSMD